MLLLQVVAVSAILIIINVTTLQHYLEEGLMPQLQSLSKGYSGKFWLRNFAHSLQLLKSVKNFCKIWKGWNFVLIMNLPIGSISGPPGVTHGSLLSRLLSGSNTLLPCKHLRAHTVSSTLWHFRAHFALCTVDTVWCREQPSPPLRRTPAGGDCTQCWRESEGSGKPSLLLLHYFLLYFYCIFVFLYFCISTAFLSVEGRIRVCGASHAALGEAALLNVENAALLNT